MFARIRDIFRRLSLVKKFSVAVILLIAVLMVTVSTLIITFQKQLLAEEIEKSHVLLARNLGRDMVDPLVFMDPLRIDELIGTVSRAPGAAYVVITDRDRRIVGHTDRKMLGKELDGGRYKETFSAISSGNEKTREIPEGGVKEIAVPVRAGYEVVGMALIGFSRSDIESVIQQNLAGLKKYILLVSGAVLLLGIWGSFILARFLTTPIKKLRDQMELVQQGNLKVQVANTNLVTCVDTFACSLTDCPAHGKKRCWAVRGTLCHGDNPCDEARKAAMCRGCIVYQESCGDEIGELVEDFNLMITRLDQSIRELEEATREKGRLEKLSALGEMSMTVAHEIKNPLNAIRGAVAYLQENFKGEVLKEFLLIIEEETKRLNEIVTSYLRYARPVPLALQEGDINAVIQETVDLVRQEATENNVEVLVALDTRIPAFRFDPNQVKQALLNILVNSLDATAAGGTIRISSAAEDGKAYVKIQDNGTGITQDVMSEIFKPFYTTKTRGSGLGLACVERIVREHRGEVSVRSERDKGTEFRVALPLN